jgi:hypothetical protein
MVVPDPSTTTIALIPTLALAGQSVLLAVILIVCRLANPGAGRLANGRSRLDDRPIRGTENHGI